MSTSASMWAKPGEAPGGLSVVTREACDGKAGNEKGKMGTSVGAASALRGRLIGPTIDHGSDDQSRPAGCGLSAYSGGSAPQPPPN